MNKISISLLKQSIRTELKCPICVLPNGVSLSLIAQKNILLGLNPNLNLSSLSNGFRLSFLSIFNVTNTQLLWSNCRDSDRIRDCNNNNTAVCVCMFVQERVCERGERESVCVCMCVSVCVHLCL
jgi:hypothetical protein